MANKVLSIEIGLNTTRVCMSDFKSKNGKVYSYAKFPTPPGSVVDGEIRMNEELVKTLTETFQSNKMKCKQVVFTIASSKIANREVTIPKVKEKQIASIIIANATDYFPIDLSQYELGHVILGTVDEGGVQKYKALVLAFPNYLIDSYRELARALGKQLVAIDYSGHSIYQMVKNECKEGTQMVVKIDEEASIVTILRDQTIVLQRTVAYGINDAINAIMMNRVFLAPGYDDALDLSTRRTCIKLSIDAKDLVETEDDPEEEDVQLMAGKLAVTNSLKMLVNGIGRVMDYHASRNAGELVEQIYITGMGADFSGLSKLFTNELGVKTKGLKHLEGFNVERAFKDGRFGEYIACMGAAVAPLGLVSDKKDKSGKKGEKGSNNGAGIAVILLVGGFAVAIALLVTGYMNYTTAQDEYQAANQRLNELRPIKEIHNNYLMTEGTYEEVVELYTLTENSNEALVEFIEELELKMPTNIHMVSLTSTVDSIALNIEVTTKEEMANAIQQLRTFESVSDVTVSGAQDEIEDGVRTVSFSAICFYKTNEQLAAEEEAAQTSN